MKPKRVVFRADASLEMGTGHVMRCLTLANALRDHGGDCHFICRETPGNLIDFVRSQGYRVHALGYQSAHAPGQEEPVLAHAAWLGTTQQEDASACEDILQQLHPHWLVVDHYALDLRWEQALESCHEHLMVIDDLADRHHQCDLLLDQTFGRNAEDYRPLVPAGCRVLCGAQYALLRPEFAKLRAYSLERRRSGGLKKILVSMGGVDKDNATCMILDALNDLALPEDCRIEVVMGAGAPWLTAVRERAASLAHSTDVRVGISNMARLMADSDLAIGAAGATAWERCCLGLPTIMVILADNQRAVAQGLQAIGAAHVIDSPDLIQAELLTMIHNLIRVERCTSVMSQAAAQVTDGRGTQSIIRYLE